MLAVVGQVCPVAGWWRWRRRWSALIRRDVRERAAPARQYRAHRTAWRTTPARAAGPSASCGAAARARPAACCTSSTAACRPRPRPPRPRPRSCCLSTSTTPSLASAGECGLRAPIACLYHAGLPLVSPILLLNKGKSRGACMIYRS